MPLPLVPPPASSETRQHGPASSSSDLRETRQHEPGSSDLRGAGQHEPGSSDLRGARQHELGSSDLRETRQHEPGASDLRGARRHGPGSGGRRTAGPCDAGPPRARARRPISPANHRSVTNPASPARPDEGASAREPWVLPLLPVSIGPSLPEPTPSAPRSSPSPKLLASEHQHHSTPAPPSAHATKHSPTRSPHTPSSTHATSPSTSGASTPSTHATSPAPPTSGAQPLSARGARGRRAREQREDPGFARRRPLVPPLSPPRLGDRAMPIARDGAASTCPGRTRVAGPHRRRPPLPGPCSLAPRPRTTPKAPPPRTTPSPSQTQA